MGNRENRAGRCCGSANNGGGPHGLGAGELMEQSKRSKGIAEWGVTQASLEEAFVKVVTSFGDGVQAQTPSPELSGGSRPERGRALE